MSGRRCSIRNTGSSQQGAGRLGRAEQGWSWQEGFRQGWGPVLGDWRVWVGRGWRCSRRGSQSRKPTRDGSGPGICPGTGTMVRCGGPGQKEVRHWLPRVGAQAVVPRSREAPHLLEGPLRRWPLAGCWPSLGGLLPHQARTPTVCIPSSISLTFLPPQTSLFLGFSDLLTSQLWISCKTPPVEGTRWDCCSSYF